MVRPLAGTRVKPFDSFFRVDPNLDDQAWKTPLSGIGFDHTIINSNDKDTPTLQAALEENINLRLQVGEKSKFERANPGTNKRTNVSLTGDQIIGDLYNQNFVLIPIAVSPYGKFGSIFERFLYGTEPLPLPKFSAKRTFNSLMANRAISGGVPAGVLERANHIWRNTRPGVFFG